MALDPQQFNADPQKALQRLMTLRPEEIENAASQLAQLGVQPPDLNALRAMGQPGGFAQAMQGGGAQGAPGGFPQLDHPQGPAQQRGDMQLNPLVGTQFGQEQSPGVSPQLTQVLDPRPQPRP